MKTTIELNEREVGEVLREHFEKLTAPLGDVDLNIRLYDHNFEEVQVPSITVEVTTQKERITDIKT